MSYNSTMTNSIRSNDSMSLMDPSRMLKSNNSHDSTESNQVKFAGEEAKDKLYEPKHNKKVIRVLTVVAYIFFVSLAAIVLSFYYVILWKPKLHGRYAIGAINTTVLALMQKNDTKCG